MNKVLLTASMLSHIAQFHKPLIDMLHEKGYEVHVAANNNLAQKSGLKLDTPDKIFEVQFSRSPYDKSNISAYKQLKRVLNENDYDIIHCNTPMCAMITRLAARKVRKSGTKIIYTAHGFHFFKGASLLNWLIYYPIEKIFAHFTDVLITINKEDYNRAKSFKAKKVAYIPGVGVDADKFSSSNVSKEEKRKELDVPSDAVVILSIGELNKNKNHEAVIKAISKLDNPNSYYFICGNGPLEEQLSELIVSLNMQNKIKLLGYRRDIADVCSAADIFVFPSLREGLSVALMEVMSAGLPVVCSKTRGNEDLIVNGEGGYLVSPNDIDKIAKALSNLIQNKKLRLEMGKINSEKVKEFCVSEVIPLLAEVYDIKE